MLGKDNFNSFRTHTHRNDLLIVFCFCQRGHFWYKYYWEIPKARNGQTRCGKAKVLSIRNRINFCTEHSIRVSFISCRLSPSSCSLSTGRAGSSRFADSICAMINCINDDIYRRPLRIFRFHSGHSSARTDETYRTYISIFGPFRLI